MIIRKVEKASTNRVKRAAAYCRVSTVDQSESYETQRAVYRSMIDADPGLSFVGIYADKGKSGTNVKNRPGFQKMLADAEAGFFDILYVKSISRFARNVGDCQRYVDDLRKKDITVIFERENIRTDDPTSNFCLALIAAVSQDESHSISMNVSMGYRERFSRGVYNLGNNRILGYDTVKGKLVPNQDAWIIREVFERFVAGEGYKAIAKALTEKGARTIHGKDLSIEAIRYIVSNETYVGDKHLQKEAPRDYITHKPDPNEHAPDYYLKDDHEAIISRELWEKAMARVEYNKAGLKLGMRNAGEHHFLYGKVFCGECGAPFLRRTISPISGERYKAWNCRERQKGAQGNGCKCRIVREEQLIEEIRQALGWETMDAGRFTREVSRVLVTADSVSLEMN